MVKLISILLYLIWYLGLGSILAMEAIQWDERHCNAPHMTTRDAAGLAVIWGFAVPYMVLGELFGADLRLGDRCYLNKPEQ